ncbi:DEAD/DEAH box helicase [Microtetraspora niveoalba]|uniref:DEAD/DEAH box helicase n=1 Tax=Microtetraspora niveoalba TaxID=46175 RepID=UPI000A062056|nr:DEAD/DEAH box helicase [Microtetraspora niveoalba]
MLDAGHIASTPDADARTPAADPAPDAQTPSTELTVDAPQESGAPVPSGDFAELGLPRPLVSALAREGITAPFPIQRAAIPDILAGRDVLGRGQTGSGKTLAFGLPTMARIAGERALPKRPLAVILVPTRELALQVADALEPLGRGLSLRTKTVVGGMSMGRQIEALRRGVEVVVATPGRLTDLMEQGECSLEDVQVTVLDEADHMCDLGFFPVVSAILEATPSDGQRLLFSATLDGDVDKLVQRFLTDPVTHSLAPETSPVETMEHHLFQVHRDDKVDVTAEIANREGRTILFVRTQHGVDRVVKQLARVGVRAGGLHGGKRQNQRTRILGEFREGTVSVLVCTDVAARGIHVDDVSLVLHVDPPMDHKSYLHRGGRTARAGESGSVVTLVMPNERRSTDAMTRRAGITPSKHRVRPGDAVLAEVAGARQPSGEAIPVWEPDVRKPLRQRREGPGGEGRSRRFGDRRERRFDRDGRPGRDGGRPFEARGNGEGGTWQGNAERAGAEGRGDRPYREDRPFRGDRGDRPFRGDREGGSFRGERRGSYQGDRASQQDRPFRGDRDGGSYRGDRPFRGDREGGSFREGRGERSFREDRPFRGDREGGSFRDERRGSYQGDRASQQDRPFRGDRDGGSSRGERDGRPFRGDRDGDRRYQGDRSRGSFGEGRGSYGGHRGQNGEGRSEQRGGHRDGERAGHRDGYRGERRPDSRGDFRAPRGGGFRQGGRPGGRAGGPSGKRYGR